MSLEIEEIAKEKGLPEFTTKQLIDLIKIEMLYMTYKNVENIVVEKPVKPKKPTYPMEPVKPFEPKEPELKTISGSGEEIEKINIDLYKDYKLKSETYIIEKETFKYAMQDYQKQSSEFEVKKIEYPSKIEDYEKNLTKFSKKQSEYERFLFQKNINKKIKETYEKWTGKKFNPNVKSDKMTYFMLIGPPGHGKTTVFRKASKLVASELGLVYKENPTVDDIVDINSFVLYVNNLAGEVSKIGTAGLPAKVKDEDGNEYTGLLPSYSMSALTKACAGVLLLDDLANASSFIQNIALPLTNENSFNELKLDGVYVGITANMGALDGTNTSTISSALRNRVKVVFTKDNIDDFIIRTRKNEQYFDEIGDFFITDFIENKKEQKDYLNKLFYTLPKKNEFGGFSNPRSLDSTIKEIRRVIYDQGGFNDENKELIKLNLMSTLGKVVGEDLYSYINDVYLDIAPLLDNYFENGIFNKELFDQKTENNLDPATKLFEYKFTKYLGKKVRSEAFKIISMKEEDREKAKDKMYEQIATIYPMLTDQQRGSFSASIREEIFLGLKEFSTYHPTNNSKEIFKTEDALKLLDKIKSKSKGLIDKSYQSAMQSITLSNAVEAEKKPPTKKRRLN